MSDSDSWLTSSSVHPHQGAICSPFRRLTLLPRAHSVRLQPSSFYASRDPIHARSPPAESAIGRQEEPLGPEIGEAQDPAAAEAAGASNVPHGTSVGVLL